MEQKFLNYQCKWTRDYWTTSACGSGVTEYQCKRSRCFWATSTNGPNVTGLPVKVGQVFLNCQCKWTTGHWTTSEIEPCVFEIRVHFDQGLLKCHLKWTRSGSEPHVTELPVKVNPVFLDYQWESTIKTVPLPQIAVRCFDNFGALMFINKNIVTLWQSAAFAQILCLDSILANNFKKVTGNVSTVFWIFLSTFHTNVSPCLSMRFIMNRARSLC
jgi:hypothetical protein